MKAIRIHEFVENDDDVKIFEIPRPQPKDGEVMVKIAAAGVNYVDLLYARGKHQNNTSLVRPPFTLGLEFAGTIVSPVPSSAHSGFSVGDRVFGASLGSYSEYICVPLNSLHHIRPSWSFAAAAGFGATATVSYGALILRGGLKHGETVLIHAGAGGVGLMAVQIAKAFGARVIATASSKEKMGVARRFGADDCVNYGEDREGEWWGEVLKLSNGEGVDVVFDPVGLVGKSLKCLKQRGRILVLGFAGREGDLESLAVNRVLLKQAIIIGYRFGMTDRIDPSETARIWQGLSALLEKNLLRPTVFDMKYSGLESVVDALKDLRARKVWGKAVISLEAEEHKSRL